MKKCIMICLVLLAGIFTLVFMSSCDDKNENSSSLLVLALFSPPPPEPAVYLFQIVESHDGDFDTNNSGLARPELNEMARAAYNESYTDLGCTQVYAFITVSDTDTIADMTINPDLPIKSPNGTLIANNRADPLMST